MAADSVLLVLSLLSFAALIVIWIAAPLHADEALSSSTAAGATAEPAQNTSAA
jgi:hypothetical protein